MTTVGIDVGGSGVKGAPVDLAAGDLAGERHRVETPQPADVKNLLTAVASVAATEETAVLANGRSVRRPEVIGWPWASQSPIVPWALGSLKGTPSAAAGPAAPSVMLTTMAPAPRAAAAREQMDRTVTARSPL